MSINRINPSLSLDLGQDGPGNLARRGGEGPPPAAACGRDDVPPVLLGPGGDYRRGYTPDRGWRPLDLLLLLAVGVTCAAVAWGVLTIETLSFGFLCAIVSAALANRRIRP